MYIMVNNKDLIQRLSHVQLADFLNRFASETYLKFKNDKDSETLLSIEQWLMQPVVQVHPNTAKVELCISFQTDGDFSFRNPDDLFDPNASLYDGVVTNYDCTKEFESYAFVLCAEGDENACSYAVWDLLNALVCNLSTSRPYIIRDVYQMLMTAKEQCLWSKKEMRLR